MLIIRHAQMKAMQIHLNACFARSVLPDIRAHSELETAGVADEPLLELLQTTIERAQLFGLHDDRDIVAFIELTFVFGHECDHSRHILDILVRDDMFVGEQEDAALPSEAPHGTVPNLHSAPAGLHEEMTCHVPVPRPQRLQ